MKQSNPFVLVLAAVALAGCPTKPDPAATPEPAGAPRTVDGTGVVNAGQNPDHRVVVDDASGEEYCLVGDHSAQVEVGDRVRFTGERFTALALKGESCLRFDVTRLDNLSESDTTP